MSATEQARPWAVQQCNSRVHKGWLVLPCTRRRLVQSGAFFDMVFHLTGELPGANYPYRCCRIITDVEEGAGVVDGDWSRRRSEP